MWTRIRSTCPQTRSLRLRQQSKSVVAVEHPHVLQVYLVYPRKRLPSLSKVGLGPLHGWRPLTAPEPKPKFEITAPNQPHATELLRRHVL